MIFFLVVWFKWWSTESN